MQLGITSSLSYPTVDRDKCKVGMQFRVETSPFEETLCVSISKFVLSAVLYTVCRDRNSACNSFFALKARESMYIYM
jgi:hypothetical protein